MASYFQRKSKCPKSKLECFWNFCKPSIRPLARSVFQRRGFRPLEQERHQERSHLGRGHSCPLSSYRSLQGHQSLWAPMLGVHTWKTAAGAPRSFLLRPAAFLSAAVRSSAFVFQLLLCSLPPGTWGRKGGKHAGSRITPSSWLLEWWVQNWRFPTCKIPLQA